MKSKTFTTLNVVTTAMLCALAVVLANASHNLAADFASLFSPMHLPVFLSGLLCGMWPGLICGAVTPLVSFITRVFFEEVRYGKDNSWNRNFGEETMMAEGQYEASKDARS